MTLRGKTYTKANAVQKGWNTASDGTGTEYALGDAVTVTADLTNATVTGSKGDAAKGKLSWVTVSLNGSTFKLKKKDFDFVSKDGGF